MCVCVCHTQEDALRPLQEFAAGRVQEDPVFLQGGTSCGGQAPGPGAAAVAADSVAIPAEVKRESFEIMTK